MTEYGLKALLTSFYGAFVDPNLWEAMTEPASRRLLRRTLLETYLPHSKDAGKEGSENYERPSIAAEPATDAIISKA